jgi:ADP-heptose:LPS heptosyltransferase
MQLTIIIPTYNRHNSVVECVAALEHNKAEIIVVDDCSEQPVVLPVKTARVIRPDRHRGRSAAINAGLRAASNDPVLIMSDDLFAAPDMVSRLVDEFLVRNNPKLCLRPRVVWDPDVPLTLTMKWMEDSNKFQPPMVLSRRFVLENGGYDENFIRRLEDVELLLRLKQYGLQVVSVESAVAFQNNVLKIRDLVEREFMDGVSGVLLHSKFPEALPLVDDMDALARNEGQTADAEAAVDEISMLEQSGSLTLPGGASELYVNVCRHYFQHGIFEGLKDMGGVKPRRRNSGTLAIFRQASHLESVGDLDEARRLFKLVLHRPDEGLWDGAEYHLGCIESSFGNSSAAHVHYIECLRLNPGHSKARRALNNPVFYRERAANVFETTDRITTPKLLFIVFGNLSHVIHAFPIVAGLREKFHAETVWLTSPEYAELARRSFADAVRESEPRGIIPWDWVQAQGFTHVFFPEPGANQEEWEQSGLHAMDFMAGKCGVPIETRQSFLEPGADAMLEAEHFLHEHGLTRGTFVTACCESEGGARHWPNSNLIKLAQQIGVSTVVFTKKGKPPLPGTVPCLERPLQVIACLIRWSCCYIGGNSGISWLATTTNTPMAVLLDPACQSPDDSGFRDLLQGEKDDIQEWDIYTSVPAVLEFVESKTLIETPR